MAVRIVHKLLASFVVVAAIGASASAFGVMSLRSTAEQIDDLTTRQLGAERIAALVDRKGVEVLALIKGFLLETAPHAEKSAEIAAKLSELETYNMMLMHGAASPFFVEGGFAERLAGMGSNVVLEQPVTGEAAEHAAALEASRTLLHDSTDKVMQAHLAARAFHYELDSRERNLLSVLEAAQIDLANWSREISKAVKFARDPEVTLEPGQTLFGQWRAATGALPDKKLEKLAVKVDKAFDDLMEYATKKVFSKPKDARELPFLRMEARRVPKVIKAIDKFTEAAVEHLGNLDREAAVALSAGQAAGNELRTNINALRASIGAAVSAAQLQTGESVSQSERLMIGAAGGGLAMALIIAFLLARGMSKPLGRMTHAMQRLATRDLSVEIDGQKRGDELGEMAKALIVFKDNLAKQRQMEADQAVQAEEKLRQTEAVKAAIAEFQDDARDLLGSVQTGLAQHEAQIGSDIAQAVERVANVSTAIEQISNSIAEIAQQVDRCNEIGGTVSTVSDDAAQKVASLVASAENVGSVVRLIDEIAEQTNLLALNATIEAARAGEAGKGFAVVAGEVKNLAGQTTNATQEIADQIEGLASIIATIEAAMRDVQTQINDVAESTSLVASSIQEQAASSEEISDNSEAATAMAKHLEQSSHTSIDGLRQAQSRLENRINDFLYVIDRTSAAA